jgi:hypothetical protein
MADVIIGRFITSLNIPVDRVLNLAIEKDLEGVVICGYDKEGNEYFASSIADGGEVIWLLERSKLKLLRIADDD